MKETDLIRIVARDFARDPAQRNSLFECDAELLQLGDDLWALTMDEFTPEEDLFTSGDPEVLGANLATATLSDLLAAGSTPRFFMHVVSLGKQADRAFIEGLSSGVKSVLDGVGCALCGGDVGMADTWRFCGFAMGPVPDNKPLTHVLPEEPQTLWITGQIGDANLAALQGLPTPRFELRAEEAELIRRHGTGCIDTSGAFLEAVWLLHEQNPRLRLEIDCDELPMARGISDLTDARSVPHEAALLGGAGDYELLFATPADLREPAKVELRDAAITPVGTAAAHGDPGVYICRKGETVRTMKAPPPCPRAAESMEEHIQDVMVMARKLFGRVQA